MDKRKLDDYRRMMADPVRMGLYREAIGRVCPGRVVCEIGVGLGPLSLMALQSGARRVYGIELDGAALELSARVMAAHGFGAERFVPLEGLSDRVSLPESVDVILSETVDGLGIGENTVHYTADACRRFLRPGGILLPHRLDCYVALADARAHRRQRAFWEEEMRRRYGMDMGPVLERFLAERDTVRVAVHELRSPWVRWQSIDLRRPESCREEVELLLQIDRPGEMSGLATAFTLDLGGELRLDTRSGRARTHWEQGYLPLPRVLPVRPGEVYHLLLRALPHDHPSLSLSGHLSPVPLELLPPTERLQAPLPVV